MLFAHIKGSVEGFLRGGSVNHGPDEVKTLMVKNCVAGTRITVWDVLHYLETGWSQSKIASSLHLSDQQVEAVTRYIEEHRGQLMVVHRQIEARKARGNPPEITAKLAQSRTNLQEWLQQHHETKT
jgi:uncharacterized protein (DUF433 family)